MFLEVFPWESLPYPSLLASLALSLGINFYYFDSFDKHLFSKSGANILANFALGLTSETFITLGLILAVPACAGKI